MNLIKDILLVQQSMTELIGIDALSHEVLESLSEKLILQQLVDARPPHRVLSQQLVD